MANITYQDGNRWYPSHLDRVYPQLTHEQFVHRLNTDPCICKPCVYSWKEEGKEEELWKLSNDTGRFEHINPKTKETTVSKAKTVEDVMDYKTALEWMTLHPMKELVDDAGNKYMITRCQLHKNGEVDHDPFVRSSFINLKLRKHVPLVYIPFWEAVKALVEGKLVGRYSSDSPYRCIDTYRFQDGQIQYHCSGQWVTMTDFFKYGDATTIKWAIKETV